MTRSIHRLTAALGALALASTLAACGGAAESNEKKVNPEWKDYTFTIGEQSDGIVKLAEESGAFDSAAYSIKFAKFDYGPPLVQAAASGDIDLGSVGAVPPITGAAKTLDFRIIAIQTPTDPKRALENIIVPKGSPLKTLADLKGKRIAIPQGSSAHGLALNAIQSAGLTTKDVEFVFLPPADGQSAFAAGKVDAWAIWDPQSSLAISQGARVLAAGVPPLDYGSQFYVGSKKTLDDPVKRKALADVVKRLAKAYAYAHSNPDRHVDALVKETGLDPEVIKSNIAAWSFRIGAVTPEQAKGEQKLADNFFEAGEIPEAVDVDDVIDNILPADFAAAK
ncbi:MAG: transporter, substrate-binding protein aliphatic sulfonates family [Aeromicrobium sp.]|nr:transporter, substrate-binding protein aliphatic sulfonates family [Aeromicrobium sp.]